MIADCDLPSPPSSPVSIHEEALLAPFVPITSIMFSGFSEMVNVVAASALLRPCGSALGLTLADCDRP